MMKSALAEMKNAPVFQSAADEILTHADEYDVAELIPPAGEKSLFQRCAFIISKMPLDFIAKHAADLMECRVEGACFGHLHYRAVSKRFCKCGRIRSWGRGCQYSLCAGIFDHF